MIKIYKKKPVEIQAIRWTGDNILEVDKFLGNQENTYHNNQNQLIIKTPEGNMVAEQGDYIIKGVKGEYYPCKPDIFKDTYEEVGVIDTQYRQYRCRNCGCASYDYRWDSATYEYYLDDDLSLINEDAARDYAYFYCPNCNSLQDGEFIEEVTKND